MDRGAVDRGAVDMAVLVVERSATVWLDNSRGNCLQRWLL